MSVGKTSTVVDDPTEGVAQCLQGADADLTLVEEFLHGSTIAINTVLERKGAVTALITTRGFRDVLEIGREWRYDLFNLDIEMPTPLVPRPLRFEINERIDAAGEVVVELDGDDQGGIIAALREAGVGSVAICLLHAYLNPDHERRVAEILEAELPGVSVSLSSDVSPELGEYERSSTVAANAYVHPVFHTYVERLITALGELGYSRDLLLVLSDGRCVRAEVAKRYPVRLVQSGPAAGAEAARMFGELSETRDLLCFDMGGTTAKACLIKDGQAERTVQFEVARETRFAEGSGLPLQIPAIDMIEIGAGGGSIAGVDGRGLLQVGPQSAGADPGPVCYGQGNQHPTVTDCDLLLGYLDESSFLGGRMALDRSAAEKAVAEHLAGPLGIAVIEAAWGVHETVTANMAQAATIHAIERALDVTRFSMLPIGGAGPLHACAMARKMGIKRLVSPTGAGVASAIGMLASAISFEISRAAPALLAGLDFARALAMLDEMSAEASAMVAGAGVEAETVTHKFSAMMRYVGQGYEIETPVTVEMVAEHDGQALLKAFSAAYRQRYGRAEEMPVELLSWRLAVSGPGSPLAEALARPAGPAAEAPAADSRRPVWFGQGFVETPVYKRRQLEPGAQLAGPAIVEEVESTVVVPPDFALAVDAAANLILTTTV